MADYFMYVLCLHDLYFTGIYSLLPDSYRSNSSDRFCSGHDPYLWYQPFFLSDRRKNRTEEETFDHDHRLWCDHGCQPGSSCCGTEKGGIYHSGSGSDHHPVLLLKWCLWSDFFYVYGNKSSGSHFWICFRNPLRNWFCTGYVCISGCRKVAGYI